MLQIHYGLNQPFNSAFTPTREPNVAGTSFEVGTWIKLVNGKAVLAGAGDGAGAEIVFEPNAKNATGDVPTICGIFEATTDKFTATSIIDGSFLKIDAGGILVAETVPATQTLLSVAMAVGAPSGGLLRFKKIVA